MTVGWSGVAASFFAVFVWLSKEEVTDGPREEAVLSEGARCQRGEN